MSTQIFTESLFTTIKKCMHNLTCRHFFHFAEIKILCFPHNAKAIIAENSSAAYEIIVTNKTCKTLFSSIVRTRTRVRIHKMRKTPSMLRENLPATAHSKLSFLLSYSEHELSLSLPLLTTTEFSRKLSPIACGAKTGPRLVPLTRRDFLP